MTASARRVAAALVGALAVWGAGCDGECDHDGEPWSVVVVLENEDGELARADSVTYSVDGEPFRECELFLDYHCGYDRAGTFTVRIDLGGEVIEETRVVRRGDDNCLRPEIVRITDSRPCATSDGGC